jgi:hypothetical protein
MSNEIRIDTKNFYAKVEKYGGWQDVPSARRFAIFEEIARPAAFGFTAIKPGRHAREISDDIIHLLALELCKGAVCGVRFGVSLRYFPFPYEPKLRWHRTLLSARFDLFEEPVSYFNDPAAPATHGATTYFASWMLGETCFREELGRAWDLAGEPILAWFESARTLEQMLQKCSEQMARDWRGARHWPDAGLVHAFTLARMGRLPEARTGLDKFCADSSVDPVTRENLGRALEKIAKAG